MSKSLMAVYGKSNAVPTVEADEDDEDETQHDVQEFASKVLSSANSTEQLSDTDLKKLSHKPSTSRKQK